MAWTQVTKPTSTSYTRVSSSGREIYDDSSVSYDDSDTFFDGFNPNMWTDITKPTLPTVNVGLATMLSMPLTIRKVTTGDSWTKVAKAT